MYLFGSFTLKSGNKTHAFYGECFAKKHRCTGAAKKHRRTSAAKKIQKEGFCLRRTVFGQKCGEEKI